MKVHELLKHIDTFAPFSLAEDWDNSGLMVGSYNAEISRVGVCLDAIADAVILASEMGCDVLLCHHPLIFRPLKQINTDDETGRTIYEALTLRVNIIAAHTNWDSADEGVNFTLAELLKLSGVEKLEGFGVVGEVPAMATNDFLACVKKSWGLSRLDFFTGRTKTPEKISRVALCGGSGAEFWRAAKNTRADVYITADMKYHELIDATHAGLNIILVEHGEMERASLPKLAEKVSACGIDVSLLDVKALPAPLRL